MRTWVEIRNAVRNNLYGKGVPGEGSRKADIVIVGEAPGANEEVMGRPFIGREGKVLRRILKEAGISAEKLYITNAVKVRPPENRRPTRDEIDYWRPLLKAEIALIKPKKVIALGVVARQSLYSLPKEVEIIRLPHPGAARYRSDIIKKIKKGIVAAAEERVWREGHLE